MDNNNNKLYALTIDGNTVGFVVKGVAKLVVTSLINSLPDTYNVQVREIAIQDLDGYDVLVLGKKQNPNPVPAEESVPAESVDVEEKPAD